MFGRFNSLFDRLGNSPFDNRNIKDLRGQILSANRLEIDFPQYFPVLQGTTAAGRPSRRLEQAPRPEADFA